MPKKYPKTANFIFPSYLRIILEPNVVRKATAISPIDQRDIGDLLLSQIEKLFTPKSTMEEMMATSLNVQLFQWIHAGAGVHPVMDGFAVFFAKDGLYIMVVLLVVFWFFEGKNKKTALQEATEAAVIGLAVNQLIGLFYFHPRPFMVGLCTPLFSHGLETSFPSDHATLMFAAAFYLLIVRRWVAWGIPLLTVAVLTAWVRVYCGIHFPFDMVGSLVVGLGSVGLMRLVAKPLYPLNERLIQMLDQLTGQLGQRKKA